MTHSIYTDKEVFLRELISNASDAMEKLRHLQVVGEAVEEGSAPLEITITTDEKEKTITIQDTVSEKDGGRERYREREEKGLWGPRRGTKTEAKKEREVKWWALGVQRLEKRST